MEYIIEIIIGIALFIGFLCFLVFVSMNRFETLLKILVCLLFLLLPLAYLVYPSGMMGTTIVNTTIGEICLLAVSIFFVITFIIGEIFIIWLLNNN